MEVRMTDFLKDDLYYKNLLEKMREEGKLPPQPAVKPQPKKKKAVKKQNSEAHSDSAAARWTADTPERYGE